MTINLVDNTLSIKSIVIYTADLEFELPNRRLQEYGDDITVFGLYDLKQDFLTIKWYNNDAEVTLIKMIAKDEIKCIDILPS